MPRLTIYSNTRGIDVGELDFSVLYLAKEIVHTPTLYRAIFDGGNYMEFRGDNFRINDLGEPSAGTVRWYRAYADGATATMAGFRVNATEIVDAAQTFSTRDDMDLLRSALSGDDIIRGDEGEDRLLGFDGDDKMRGGSKSDRLFGNDGDDVIWGNKGKDRVYGNNGDDTLVGGPGRDFMLGGDGADTFRFNAGLNSRNIDKISDFVPEDDRIQLDRDFFGRAGPKGELDGSAFAIGDAAGDSSDRIIYDPEAGALFYDRDGTGDVAQVQFAVLGTGLAISAADFVLFG